jgi:hypothetical protein
MTEAQLNRELRQLAERLAVEQASGYRERTTLQRRIEACRATCSPPPTPVQDLIRDLRVTRRTLLGYYGVAQELMAL